MTMLILRRHGRAFACPRRDLPAHVIVPDIPDRLPHLWHQYLYRCELRPPSGDGSEWPHAPSSLEVSRLASCPHRGSDLRASKCSPVCTVLRPDVPNAKGQMFSNVPPLRCLLK